MKKLMMIAAVFAASACFAPSAQAQDVVKKENKECCQKKDGEKKDCCKKADEQKTDTAKCANCKKHAGAKKHKKGGIDGQTGATAQQQKKEKKN